MKRIRTIGGFAAGLLAGLLIAYAYDRLVPETRSPALVQEYLATVRGVGAHLDRYGTLDRASYVLDATDRLVARLAADPAAAPWPPHVVLLQLARDWSTVDPALAATLLQRIDALEGEEPSERTAAAVTNERLDLEVFLALSLGQPGNAIGHAERQVALVETSALGPSADYNARENLAWALLEAGRLEDARMVLEALLDQTPATTDADQWFTIKLLGESYFREEQYEIAAELFGQAREAAPDDVRLGWNELQRQHHFSLFRLGRYDESIAQLEPVLATLVASGGARAGIGYAAANLAQAYAELGEIDRADELARQAMAAMSAPGNIDRIAARHVLALSLAGRSALARESLDRAFGTRPRPNRPVSALLADVVLALDAGDREGARSALEAALGAADESPTFELDALGLLVSCHASPRRGCLEPLAAALADRRGPEHQGLWHRYLSAQVTTAHDAD